jgi:hypothetical protein
MYAYLHAYGYFFQPHSHLLYDTGNRARMFKLSRSPRIDSKELILPTYVAWRAGIPTRFLAPIDCLKIQAQVKR